MKNEVPFKDLPGGATFTGQNGERGIKIDPVEDVFLLGPQVIGKNGFKREPWRINAICLFNGTTMTFQPEELVFPDEPEKEQK